MRINQPGNNPLQGTDSTKKSDATARATQTKKSDDASATDDVKAIAGTATAEISSRGKEAAKAMATAKDAPDVREAKIAELRQRISEGKYNVKPDDIADRMVDDHITMGQHGLS